MLLVFSAMGRLSGPMRIESSAPRRGSNPWDDNRATMWPSWLWVWPSPIGSMANRVLLAGKVTLFTMYCEVLLPVGFTQSEELLLSLPQAPSAPAANRPIKRIVVRIVASLFELGHLGRGC